MKKEKLQKAKVGGKMAAGKDKRAEMVAGKRGEGAPQPKQEGGGKKKRRGNKDKASALPKTGAAAAASGGKKGRGKKEAPKTREELDAELDSYRQKETAAAAEPAAAAAAAPAPEATA